MTKPGRQMHLGVFVLGTGNHIAGWRYPGAAQSFEDLSVVQEIARIAERGKFDLIFLGDNLATEPGMHPSFAARFEPLTMLAALAATTTHVGLGATSSTTYNEPYNVARAFASLDHLSGGRAAWNAVTSSGGKAAENFGRIHPEHDARLDVLARAHELGLRGRLLAQALQLLADDLHGLDQVVRPRADVQADLARVGVLARERVDAVREPALLAHGLEQP